MADKTVMDLETDVHEVHTNSVDDITLKPEAQPEADPVTFDKRRSKVWKDFLRISEKDSKDGKLRAICRHCNLASFVAASHYGTSNMKNHLAKCQAYLDSTKTQGEGNEFDQKIYRELVAKAIIKHGYAFSWVEHEGNRKIHAYLNDRVRTICRNTIKSDCLKLCSTLKAQLKNILRNVPGRISLTCDMWTSCQTEGYMCVTAHYVDENWKLNCRVLNFCHIDSPHTGQTMYSALLDLLQDWGIDSKIFSITLDNASSNDKMQDYLRNTLVERGLCCIEIRESVKYVKWSETRKNTFRRCVKQAKIQETKALWLDVPTRWNSTYMMLDRALLCHDAFKQMLVLDPSYRQCPSHDEWEMLEKIRDILEPFYDITMLFSGSNYPTSNLYFENVWKIAMLLKELEKSDVEVLRLMAKEMKSKFDKYWFTSTEDDYGTLFSFASILDPRSKLSKVRYCYEKLFEDDETRAVLKVSDVHFKLGMFFKEYTSKNRPCEASPRSSNTNNTIGSSGSKKRSFDFFAYLDKREAGNSCYGKTHLDIYLEDAKMDRQMPLDILNFWKENEHRYGELSHLARDILTVALTTVASESTFSIGGRVLNKWRSSYLPENIEALITTRSWLYGFEEDEDDDFVGCDVNWTPSTSVAS